MVSRGSGFSPEVLSPGRRPIRRFVVVGTTGAGKTTFARRLAAALGVPCHELDCLHWGENWTKRPAERVRVELAELTAGDGWVIDGNWHGVRDLVWGQGQALIWLDYSLCVVMWRLFRRTLQRLVCREELWNGNRETWRGQFASGDSLFLWALRSRPHQRQSYPEALASEAYRHLRVWRFARPRQAEDWLTQVEARGRLP